MAEIEYPIPDPKHLEISKRIAEILRDELDHQIDVVGNSNLRRGVPPDRTVRWEEDTMIGYEDCPVLIVSFSQSREDAASQVHREDTMRFMIDVHERGVHQGTDEATGYSNSNMNLQRMLGFVHHVLYHPNNRHLGFPKRFVNRLAQEETNIFGPTTGSDAESLVSGRIEAIYEVDRDFTLDDPRELNTLGTKMRIEESDDGYYFVDNA